MDDLKKRFNESVKELGGVLKDNSMLYNIDALSVYLDQSSSFISKSCLPYNKWKPIYIDYVDSHNFNAVAFTVGSQDFIGINWGVILLLREIFYRIMSSPSCMTHIGSPDNEKHDLLPFDNIYPDIIVLLKNSGTLTPKDPVRRCYADICTLMAVNFIVAHEASHITNGHTEWVSCHLGYPSYIIESIKTPNGVNDPLTRQTLEYDADAGAVLKSTQLLFRNIDKLRDTYENANIPTYAKEAHELVYADCKSLMFCFLFSINMVFRLFDELYWDDDILNEMMHPPSSFRFFCAHVSLWTCFYEYKWGGYSEKIVETVSPNVLKETLRSINTISTLKQNVEGILKATNNLKYKKRLDSRWHTLRDELEPYARCNLAPKQTV